jgi:molybdopterin/thiamine biosynthesis adenylyltransferase
MERPRIRSCYSITPNRDKEGVLYIGSALGYASAIEDVDEPLLEMLKLVDGEHTIEDIVEVLRSRRFQATEETVRENLSILDEYGLLEDAATLVPTGLSDAEWERYDRQVLFFSIFEDRGGRRYEYQKMLKKSRVTILGLGGLGSHILYHLAASGVEDILGVDFDVVEPSNLTRQLLYATPDIGRSKVDVACERIKALNPHVHFEGRTMQISSANDLEELVSYRDLVIAVADAPAGWIQRWINEACLAQQVPYISAGYTEQVGQAGPLTIPYQTSCYDCRCHPEGRPLPLDPENLLLGKRGRVPALGPLVGMMAGFLGLEALKYLTGLAPPVTLNKIYSIDVGTMEMSSRVLNERSLACPSCGTQTRLKTSPEEMPLVVW